jgi:glycosyltransferase involved in cell wall biosynthesis
LEEADRIVGVSPTWVQAMRNQAPRRPAGDFVTIENGYDEDDFKVAPETTGALQDGVTTIAHVGRAYAGIALPLLRALSRLEPDRAARLRVRFVGGLAVQETRWLGTHTLGARIEVLGRVAHPAAIEHMRAADALLLAVGTEPFAEGLYPGKLFEYMIAGRPVLMVGREGDAANLVRSSGVGLFAPADDIDAIAQVLGELATAPEQFRARHYSPRPDVIATYERRGLARKLADVFEDACATGHEG